MGQNPNAITKLALPTLWNNVTLSSVTKRQFGAADTTLPLHSRDQLPPAGQQRRRDCAVSDLALETRIYRRSQQIRNKVFELGSRFLKEFCVDLT